MDAEDVLLRDGVRFATVDGYVCAFRDDVFETAARVLQAFNWLAVIRFSNQTAVCVFVEGIRTAVRAVELVVVGIKVDVAGGTEQTGVGLAVITEESIRCISIAETAFVELVVFSQLLVVIVDD